MDQGTIAVRSRGLAQDDSGMRGVAAAGLKGLLYALNGYINQGIPPLLTERRLYFSLGTLAKAFLTLKSSGAVPLPSRDSCGEKELFRVLKLGMALRGRKSIYSCPRSS
jgi:hypothetical protein